MLALPPPVINQSPVAVALAYSSSPLFRGAVLRVLALLVVVVVLGHMKKMKSTFVMNGMIVSNIFIVFNEKEWVFGDIFYSGKVW